MVYFVIASPLCVLIFLSQSAYFLSWDGHAVSVRPSRDAKPSMYTVLIVNQDGSTLERNWDADTVESLVLPVDAYAMPPRDVSDRPKTQKEIYALSFSVQPAITIDIPDDGEDEAGDEEGAEDQLVPEPEWTSHPTTSPQALLLSLFAWLIGLGLRNMVVSGSPFDLSPRQRHRVEQQQNMGAPARSQRGKSTKGAPSGGTSRKRKRRPR
jgi:hypothetical protein